MARFFVHTTDSDMGITIVADPFVCAAKEFIDITKPKDGTLIQVRDINGDSRFFTCKVSYDAIECPNPDLTVNS